MSQEFRYGDNVTLECKDGYALEGSPQSQCQADSTWDPPLATCTSTSGRHNARIIGIVSGVVLFIVSILVSCWMILKRKKRNTDAKSKEVDIHLHPPEGSSDHAQSLQTNEEPSSVLP